MTRNKEKIFIISVILFWIMYLLSFMCTCLIKRSFDLRYLFIKETIMIFILIILITIVLILWYYWKHYWIFNSKKIIKSNPKDLIDANLEQARFQTDEELDKNYKSFLFSELKDIDITGSPIKAIKTQEGLKVTFAKPSHALVIGTTGSGKTTTYVSPMIQILSETKTKPSLFISDPKGELLINHKKALIDKGYEVKVVDLRNPYNSVRWNPMERPYLMYQKANNLDKEIIVDEERGCYIFENEEFNIKEELDSKIQVKRQQLLDEVYEDLNDIATSICPITNKNEPMWESGAKNLILAIALAMLEDSIVPGSTMTKEKYNFYSLMKDATSTEDECKELINYFKGRSPLSRSVSLSKQVMDSSDKTRGSYLSTCFDKLSIFSDMSLCALTSENEIEFSSMGDKPIALFLQIPDEKETRHTLASLLILQAYKELVRKANLSIDLTLKRPVYFILDEFGNLPQIHKLEQMITVGRSRNIWMNLVVQSYSQLAKVYDEKSADIIKSNCNIQVFIGTTDLKTIEDFSKRCGNYSIIQRSVGYQSTKADDINSNQSIKERPLIYPTELQTLNRPGDMGHAIVTIFGFQPIKSTFTPIFMCDEYKIEKTLESKYKGRFFDESKAFYDIKKRNEELTSEEPKIDLRRESLKNELILRQIIEIAFKGVSGILSLKNIELLKRSIKRLDFNTSLNLLNEAYEVALKTNNIEKIEYIENAEQRLKDLIRLEERKII